MQHQHEPNEQRTIANDIYDVVFEILNRTKQIEQDVQSINERISHLEKQSQQQQQQPQQQPQQQLGQVNLQLEVLCNIFVKKVRNVEKGRNKKRRKKKKPGKKG